jgi:hypothetical protein
MLALYLREKGLMVMNTAWQKLGDLLDHHSFELLNPPTIEGEHKDLYVVYLMNDAAESFLVLRNAHMTGEYDSEYDGETKGCLSEAEDGYVVILRRGELTSCIFFEDISWETELFDYGQNGHFWIKGYEYLRQIEYKVAIVADKLNYLGEDSCTEGEKKIAALENFPPLNYTHYPASPLEYIEGVANPWDFSDEAYSVMKELCVKTNDYGYLTLLRIYKVLPTKLISWYLSAKLRSREHAKLVDEILSWIRTEAKHYKQRDFGEDEKSYSAFRSAAELLKDIYEARGFKSEVYFEEPFQRYSDDIEFGAYVLSYENHLWARKCVVRKIGDI